MKTAVFPGSFDPITIGHVDIVRRAQPLFDRILISVGVNSQKQTLYNLEKRVGMIQKIFRDDTNIEIHHYSGLTVDFCRKAGAQYILRGIRGAGDFEFERSIAQMNKAIEPDVETIFLIARPQLSAVSSSIVRDIILNGGDASAFVHREVVSDISL